MVNSLVHGDFDGIRLHHWHGDMFLDRDGDRFLDGYWYVLLNRIRDFLLHRDRNRLHYLYRDVLWHGNVDGIGLRNTDCYRMWHRYRHGFWDWYTWNKIYASNKRRLLEIIGKEILKIFFSISKERNIEEAKENCDVLW